MAFWFCDKMAVMSEEKGMSKDTRAIIIAIVMATVAVIGINKADISDLRTELRTDIRELSDGYARVA